MIFFIPEESLFSFKQKVLSCYILQMQRQSACVAVCIRNWVIFSLWFSNQRGV